MHKRCPNCRSANFTTSEKCLNCGADLTPTEVIKRRLGLVHRALVCIVVCLIMVAGLYISLIGSAAKLTSGQKMTVSRAIDVLRVKGYSDEVRLLSDLTVFRSDDNWLNASVEKENAYAATNFPFEIMTLYPGFFTATADDTERAAILLHEAQHLKGKGEHDAYEFVWKNRERLGWTSSKYGDSPVWQNVRKQTKEVDPGLFVCNWDPAGDCTEPARLPGE